jgi:hypothetical protein
MLNITLIFRKKIDFYKTKYGFVTIPTAAPTLRLSSSTPSSIYIEWDLLSKEKCNI